MRIPVTLSLLVSVLACSACVGEQGTATAAEASAQGKNEAAQTFKQRRLRMVEQQIRARGITDPAVLEAMREVPRHRFVPPSLSKLAYSDQPLPIGHGQTISQPYIVAFMAAAADIDPNDKVLEIGTGSGYGAAVLAELAKKVYTIEIIPELAKRARETLQRLGYDNVHVKIGNGWLGWAEHAPYDAIVVTASPDEIPQALIEQLAVGGTMVIPVNNRMLIIKKTKDGLIKRSTFGVRFVPMVAEPGQD